MNLDEFYSKNLRIQLITDKGLFTDDFPNINNISRLITLTKKHLKTNPRWSGYMPLDIIACRIKIAENIFINIK